MTIERIRELRNARPFKPFELHLRNGRRVSVRRGDSLALSPAGSRIVVFEPDDSHHNIDVAFVSEVIFQKKARRSNKP